ncbi:NEP1-interacting protein 1 [Dichanthelium oligosanthes]|uniref:NEP1-interacting protein 1 n=1 Tax=Dichanthelium oligosanthes TaxID=888268 RepID=A0A1E5W3R9_9POAL|nr:NEP1-interacting protein 1 [Dichanthelium oligosanthes]
MDPSGGFLQQLPQQGGSAVSFPRSSSNVSLARSGSGGSSAGRGRGATRGRRMMRRVCRGVITFIFAIAGLFLGAVTGGLIGLATESGLFRGTGIGAITGALVSIEVVDSSIRLWQARRSGIWSILYVLNVIYSLLTGRLVREKVDPAVQRVVRSQVGRLIHILEHMNAVDSSPFRESPDLFEVEATNGMPRASIDKLPESWITEEYKRDTVGDLSGCSVCLQDFQVGEKVRSLPDCWHVFHVPCIDGWLIKHGSCPLCRRKL